jgi:adenylylsulfate kinase
VSDPYEAPVNPELVIKTHEQTLDESVAQVIAYLEERNFIPLTQTAN